MGVAFLFRPLGAIICGHLGDRYGLARAGRHAHPDGLGHRADRPAAVYAVLGVWAPVLLVGLRVLQGFSAGGEWGGAA